MSTRELQKKKKKRINRSQLAPLLIFFFISPHCELEEEGISFPLEVGGGNFVRTEDWKIEWILLAIGNGGGPF